MAQWGAMEPRPEVVIEPYTARWIKEFEGESEKLRSAFGEALIEVHHIGSTAVPGLAAKPVIDVLLVARSLAAADAKREVAEREGYRWEGENGIPGRRYLVRLKPHGRRHHSHVHLFTEGDPQVGWHLRFRDYLRTHPGDAAAYGRLKAELAKRFRTDRDAYQVGKEGFIEAALQKVDRSSIKPGGA